MIWECKNFAYNGTDRNLLDQVQSGDTLVECFLVELNAGTDSLAGRKKLKFFGGSYINIVTDKTWERAPNSGLWCEKEFIEDIEEIYILGDVNA